MNTMETLIKKEKKKKKGTNTMETIFHTKGLKAERVT